MSARLPRIAARAQVPALALALAVLLLAGGRAQAQPADSSARPLPSGLELLHLVPGNQPPLATLDPENFGQLRDQFNADSNVARVLLMLSPT